MTTEPLPETPKAVQAFSRRRLLQAVGAGAGIVVLGGAELRSFAWTSSSTKDPAYHSRPDFNPPPITVLVPAAGTAPGLVFLSPSQGPSQFGPMIVDNKGEPVWFKPLPHGVGISTNFQVTQYLGKPVLSWWEGELLLPAGYGKGEYVLTDTSYQEITRVQAGNGLVGDLHEFAITPKGTALLTAYDAMPADLSSIGGPKVGTLLNSLFQEVDIATGKVIFEWDARQHIGLDESYLPASSAAANNGLYDFFHINSIDVDVDGNYIVSGRHTWAVYKIDRSSGEIIWRLNGKLSNFSMGPKSQFAFQHHVRHHGNDHLTIFDDGGGPPNVSAYSRGLELRLDYRLMRAFFVQQFLPNPQFLATSQGSVQILPNDNVFVGWGAEPYWSEYSSDGRMLFNAQFEPADVSYRAFRYPWVGQPIDVPAMSARRTARNEVQIFASWNGATEVASWNVLAGFSPATLTQVSTADREGFETHVSVTTTAPYFAAAAVDRAGNVLATSIVVRA
ncbi:MAG: arylsulfotransferase family protein [Acidimicrobiales bacterium]